MKKMMNPVSTTALKLLASVSLAALVATSLGVQAGPAESSPQSKSADAAPRVGLGQPAAAEPATLGNLRLNDPLVQQKYLNEPDMLRFLRGTYSEACTRGLVNQAVSQMAVDLKREYTAEQRRVAAQLQESKRIWKMTSFEMETLYGGGYLNAANYCDCLMREVSDADLVNPRKGLEVIEKLNGSVQRSCEATAQEQTKRQVKAREAKAK